uniref:Uncharacterized protein n=1 Tax=Cyanoderma ruficeps TaxID=181631 RepID=A0A8C3RGX5_9PASS
MGSPLQFCPTRGWLWTFGYGVLSHLKKALFTKPAPGAEPVWFRGLRSPAPREMCHLHPALFLELRFAERKGWADGAHEAFPRPLVFLPPYPISGGWGCLGGCSGWLFSLPTGMSPQPWKQQFG